jgi:site-specific recombinase XerD
LHILDGFKRYLIKSEFSSNTINCYLRDVKGFLSQLQKDILVLDEFDLLEYKQVLLKQEVSVITVNRKLASINTFCRYLWETNQVSEEYHVKLIKNRDKPEYKGIQPEMLPLLKELVYQSKNPLHICILELLLGTGIRVSELVNLNLNDVTLSEKTSTLLETRGFIRILGKGMVNRTLPMNQKVETAIKEYLKVRKETKFNRLFIGQRGALGRGAVEIILKNYGKKLGIAITPHMLRHTVGYQLVKKHTPMTTIQQILGHESILTTNLYTQTTEQDKADALNSLAW